MYQYSLRQTKMEKKVPAVKLLLECIIMCSCATIITADGCNIEVQADFEIAKFLGRWYEMMWIPPSYLFQNESYLDFQHNYSLQKDGNISIHIRGRDPAKASTCFDDFAVLRPTSEPGKLTYVRYVAGRVNESSDYWIIGTDYNNYAITYGCRVRNQSICEEVDSWIWSRSRALTQQHIEAVKTVIGSICLNVTDYSNTQQTNDCSMSSNASATGIDITTILALCASFLTFINIIKNNVHSWF